MLQITPLERAALELLASGADMRVLAERFGLNERAVEAGLASLFARMGVGNVNEALAAAVRRGLVTSRDYR